MRYPDRTKFFVGVGLMIAALAVTACGSSTVVSTQRSGIGSAGSRAASPAAADTTVSAYFIRDEKVGPVGRPATTGSELRGALEGLLAGPTPTESQLGFRTNIPAGTSLLDVSVSGGVATVDLSTEFTSGGGSLSMFTRVAEVVFTATQFPSVDSVLFSVDGTVLTVLGGEGIILDGPQTRADWEGQAPAILVESPRPFETVSSPLHISGTANTFEATFQVNIVDGDGLIVYDNFAMATSGTGTRGTFDLSIPFVPVKPGIGALIVWEVSAKDGSRINLVEIPITIPATMVTTTTAPTTTAAPIKRTG